MTDRDTTRGDWQGGEWAGEEPATPANQPAGDPTWSKTEYVGDQGSGTPGRQDADDMPEGDTSISGNRHPSGEQHWADPATDTARTADADTR